MSKKIIVITGATSGIGKYLKERFEFEGHTVINISRTAEDNGKTSFSCDLSDLNRLKEVTGIISRDFPFIDIIINCAGYGISGATELISEKEIKRIFDVNVLGAIFISKYLLPNLKKEGKIINICSACAIFTLPFRSIYCATKSALLSFSDGIRMELGHTKIQVCALLPGDIKSNFTNARIKSFDTNNRYGERVKNATDAVDSRNEKRMDLSVAGDIMYKIINKKKLKATYIIGNKYKFLNFIKKFVSHNLLLKFIQNKFGGKKNSL